jgi:hypothetical protein
LDDSEVVGSIALAAGTSLGCEMQDGVEVVEGSAGSYLDRRVNLGVWAEDNHEFASRWGTFLFGEDEHCDDYWRHGGLRQQTWQVELKRPAGLNHDGADCVPMISSGQGNYIPVNSSGEEVTPDASGVYPHWDNIWMPIGITLGGWRLEPVSCGIYSTPGTFGGMVTDGADDGACAVAGGVSYLNSNWNTAQTSIEGAVRYGAKHAGTSLALSPSVTVTGDGPQPGLSLSLQEHDSEWSNEASWKCEYQADWSSDCEVGVLKEKCMDNGLATAPTELEPREGEYYELNSMGDMNWSTDYEVKARYGADEAWDAVDDDTAWPVTCSAEDENPPCDDDDGDGYCASVDCDDADATAHPGATEVCDGVDNNCVGGVDEGLAFVTYHSDSDGDGYGDATMSFATCDGPPMGYVGDDTDCDDADATANPGATEICDGIDNDCQNGADDGLNFGTYYADSDGDGYGDPTIPDSSCSGAPMGYVVDMTDCDDGDGSTFPGASELCDGMDNDCDGTFDEGCAMGDDDDSSPGDDDDDDDASNPWPEGSPPSGDLVDSIVECSDAMDNDGDGQIDASDSDCDWYFSP